MYYFAFGSNMDPQRMKSRGLDCQPKYIGLLRGYRLAFDKQSSDNPNVGFANIRPANKRSVVYGVLYDIPYREILLLDGFEGSPKHYLRETLRVEVPALVETVSAAVYIANSGRIKEGLLPTSDYLRYMLATKGLPYKYMSKLKRQQTIEQSAHHVEQRG